MGNSDQIIPILMCKGVPKHFNHFSTTELHSFLLYLVKFTSGQAGEEVWKAEPPWWDPSIGATLKRGYISTKPFQDRSSALKRLIKSYYEYKKASYLIQLSNTLAEFPINHLKFMPGPNATISIWSNFCSNVVIKIPASNRTYDRERVVPDWRFIPALPNNVSITRQVTILDSDSEDSDCQIIDTPVIPQPVKRVYLTLKRRCQPPSRQNLQRPLQQSTQEVIVLDSSDDEAPSTERPSPQTAKRPRRSRARASYSRVTRAISVSRPLPPLPDEPEDVLKEPVSQERFMACFGMCRSCETPAPSSLPSAPPKEKRGRGGYSWLPFSQLPSLVEKGSLPKRALGSGREQRGAAVASSFRPYSHSRSPSPDSLYHCLRSRKEPPCQRSYTWPRKHFRGRTEVPEPLHLRLERKHNLKPCSIYLIRLPSKLTYPVNVQDLY